MNAENMRQPVVATLTYKTKVREFADNGGRYIDYKKTFSRHDCNLKPCDHDYYNCDMFPGMLNRAATAAQGNKTWCRLEDLPECITLDDSGFLAVVTIHITI